MQEFIKAYNAATGSQRGFVIPAVISVYEDRSFSFVTKTPPTATLLAKAAGVAKGTAHPSGSPAAWISREQLREVARPSCRTSTRMTSTRPRGS